MAQLLKAALVASAVFASPALLPAQGIPVDLVVAATTDAHGRVRAWDYFGDSAEATRGLTRLATAVDSIRAAHPGNVLLVDSGDLLQGNPFTYVASRPDWRGPHPTIAAMNAMRYDAAAVGNHEFNYGLPFLTRAVGEAKFPFLAANARRPDGSRPFKGYVMVQRAGINVALVGATNPGANTWDRNHLAGRLVVDEIVPSVRQAVEAARAAGAELVVALLHSGLGDTAAEDPSAPWQENVAARVAREVPGIDLIVVGHTHREMADTTINGVMLMQARQWAGSLAVATVRMQNRGAAWTVTEKHGQIVRAAGHAEQSEVVAAAAAGHEAARRYAGAVVASTPDAWRSDSARTHASPIVDLVLDVERRVMGAELSSTAAFDLAAGFGPGGITNAQLARLYPYENTLSLLKLSGEQLRAYLEQSAKYFVVTPGDTPRVTVNPSIPGYNFDIVGGASYQIDLTKPIGERIVGLTVRGKPVAATDSFTFAVNNYRAGGGGGYGMLRGLKVLRDTQVEIRDLLIADLARRKSVRRAEYATAGWRIVPAAYADAAYAALNRRGTTRPGTGRALPADEPVRLPTSLRIISTNDFHGALEPRPDGNQGNRGGAAYLAHAIRTAQKECAAGCVNVLLDGGDMFQGTPGSNLAFGRPVAQLFNTLGYAAGALGNHEFDWGQDSLRARIRELKHAVLAANVRTADGKPVPWVRADTMVDRDGLKIGIIGVASTGTPRTTKASNVSDLRFLDPVPIVNERARALRARGASIVVIVAHDGAFCNGRGAAQTCDGDIIRLAQGITEKVDAIVSGHTHSLVNTVINGIPVVQARSGGRAIAVVDLPLDGQGRAAGTARAWVRNVDSDTLTADPDVAALVKSAAEAVAPRVNQIFGTLRTAMTKHGEEYALGHFMADAHRVIGEGDVAVVNNGGIRADLPAGNITYGTLFEVAPFGNVLYRVTVRGDALRAYFDKMYDGQRAPRVHLSGATLSWDAQRHLTVVMGDGKPLDDAREYRLILTDFLLTGGDGLGVGQAARLVEPVNMQDLDALIAYVRRQPGGVVTPDETPRLILSKP